ncbi:uncharacterized protein LOC126884279 [Diabrotica virgifera virgifera]|uniref:Uncharacterized protein n=2 Tax=Diabrotica virgifera virgifera TaxID=50390 RepID=A0ABM5K7K3_DIAVI|nr:uncharacterized protein LOC126884279 [Diabrotica virgifera virgifera]
MAHMEIIINHYQHELETEFKTIHFLSDSPSSQYRNKKMFFYLQQVLPKLFPQIQHISWNYSEAGHGKGAPDGIGATIKRTADQLITFNHDINNFDVFVKCIQENISNIHIKCLNENNIEKFDAFLPPLLKPYKGTMQTHQVTWNHITRELSFRTLSCFKCSFENCIHYAIENKVAPLQSSYLSEENDNGRATARPTGIEEFSEDTWVTAIFDNDWYPGIIEKIDRNIMTVNFMMKNGKSFFWPDIADRQTVTTRNGILCQLVHPPEPVSNRFYKIQEYDYIDNLFKSSV